MAKKRKKKKGKLSPGERNAMPCTILDRIPLKIIAYRHHHNQFVRNTLHSFSCGPKPFFLLFWSARPRPPNSAFHVAPIAPRHCIACSFPFRGPYQKQQSQPNYRVPNGHAGTDIARENGLPGPLVVDSWPVPVHHWTLAETIVHAFVARLCGYR